MSLPRFEQPDAVAALPEAKPDAGDKIAGATWWSLSF
jgi:hypothetical protein